MLFASAQPLSAAELARILQVDEGRAVEAVRALERQLEEQGRGIQLVEVAGGFQLVTRARFFPYLRRAALGLRRAALSPAALETLAVVAYRQPCTRAEIEAIRGVSCERALATLLERGLIEVAERRDGPGRPVLYRTTRRFLELFGLKGLEDLPPLERFGSPELGPGGSAQAS